MKIYLNEQSMKDIEKIKDYLHHEAIFNCNFANTKYEILSDDVNWIDEAEENIGTLILIGINEIVYFHENEVITE